MIEFIKKYRIRLIFIAVIAIIYFVFFSKKAQDVITAQDIVSVDRGNIKSTIQVLGTTKLTNSQTLTFGQPGRIKKLYIKAGDIVRKGQVLAEIDTRDAVNDIRATQLSIASAQANYNKLLTNLSAKPTEDGTLKSTASLELENIRLEKEIKVTEQKNNVEQIERLIVLNTSKVDSTQKDIEFTKQNGTQTVQQSDAAYNAQVADTLLTARSSIIDAKDLLNNVKVYLYLDPNQQKPSELGAKDFYQYSSAADEYNKLKTAIVNLESYLNTASVEDTTGARTLASKNVVMIDSAITLSDYTYNTLDQSAAGATISQSTLSSQKASIVSARSKLVNHLSSINNTIQAIDSAGDPSTTQLGTDSSVSTKEQVLQSLQNDITNSKVKLDEAKNSLNKLISDYDLRIRQKKDSILNTSQDKQSASINIQQAQVSLAKAQKRLEDYQIIAQFDGVISSVDFKEGDLVSALKDSITIEVPGIYEINILLDQLDVVNVRLGQEAVIKLDAYPNLTFTGTIDEIDSDPLKDGNVVSYKATIIMKRLDKAIYNEMTVTVDLATQERESAIRVPALAVINSGSTNFVQVVAVDKSISYRGVIIGLSDGNYTEIVSGLSIGEQVATKEFKLVDKVSGFSFGPPRNTGGNSTRDQLQKMQGN